MVNFESEQQHQIKSVTASLRIAQAAEWLLAIPDLKLPAIWRNKIVWRVSYLCAAAS